MSGVAVSYMRDRIWLIRSQLIGLGQVFPIKFLPFQLRKRAPFAEVIELDNQFDRFLFEGGNDPFGKESDDLLAPEKE